MSTSINGAATEFKLNYSGGRSEKGQLGRAQAGSSSYITMAKRGLFEVLMPMSSLEETFGLILLLLNSFQAYGALYSALDPINWHSSFADWLSLICDTILLRKVLFGNTAALYGFFAIQLIFWIFLVGVYLLKRTSQYFEWSGILSRASSILLSIIMVSYFPLSSLLGSIVSCQVLSSNGNQMVPISSCWSDGQLISFVISIVAYLLLMAVVTMKNLLMTEPSPFRSYWTAKSHGRIDVFESLVMSILIFLGSSLFGLMQSDIRLWIMYKSLVAVASALIAGLNFKNLPYYHNFCQYFKILVYCTLTWSSLCAIFLKSVSAKGYEAAIFIYPCGIFVLSVFYNLISTRIRYLIKKPIEKCASPEEIELKIRYLLMTKNAFFCAYTSVINGSGVETTGEMYREASTMYSIGLQKFPKSAILYYSYSIFLFGKCNFNYCLMMMAKSKNSRGQIGIDLDYQMLRKKKIIERIFANQKGTTEVSNYFRYLELSRSTDFLQKQFVAKKLALLTELRKRPSPSPKRLMRICRQFYSLLLVVQRNFEQMYMIDNSSKNLRNYASFVSNILSIAPLTRLIVDQADELDSKRVEKQNSIETQAALFNQKNSVFVISGEEKNLGEILDVNLGGIDMFGFTSSSEIIGMNISTMMPSPYSEMHNGFLRKYLQTGVTSILDIVRTVVARDKLGFLFEVRLYVRQLIDRKGIKLVDTLLLIELSHETGDLNFVGLLAKNEIQAEFIIIDEHGMISSVSRNCIHIFKTGLAGSAENLENQESVMQGLRQIHISTWIPDWELNKPLFAKDHGFLVRRMQHEMHIRLRSFASLGSPYSLLEIWVDEYGNSRSKINLATLKSAQEPEAVRSESILRIRTEPLQNFSSGGKRMIDSVELMGGSTANTSDLSSLNEEDDMLENTALNLIPSFQAAVQAYTLRMGQQRDTRSSSLRYRLATFGLAYLIWLIVLNWLVSSYLKNAASAANDIGLNVLRKSEVVRLKNSLRSMQLAKGCLAIEANSTLCQNIIATPLTAAELNTSKSMLINAASAIYSTNLELLTILAGSSADAIHFKPLKALAVGELINFSILRSQSASIDVEMSTLEASQLIAVSGEYLSNTHYTPHFASSLDGVTELPQPSLLYNESDAFKREAAFAILKNGLKYQSFLDYEDTARTTAYERELNLATTVSLMASLISIGVIILLIAVYMFPIVRALVEWQTDILNTLISVPQPLVRWWYQSLIRKLEEDFREEDITAELYFYLQQRDDADVMAAAISNRKSPKKKNVEFNGETNKRIKATAVTGSVMPSQNRRMRLSIHTVLNSMGQRHIFIKLFLSSLIIIALPALSLLPISNLNQAGSVARQLEWLSDSIVHAQRVHYDVREAALAIYGSGNSTRFIRDAEKSLSLFIDGTHNLIYGEGPFTGLQSSPDFKQAIFADSCQFIDPAVAASMVIKEPCEKFDNSIMVIGLKAALFKYQQLATLAIQRLTQGSVTETTRATILLMESYLPQINSVCLSMIPRISKMVEASYELNTNVIEPVQLVLAILCCLFLYFAAYMPFVKALEDDTYSLHHVLNILWKSADGILKNKQMNIPRLASIEAASDNVLVPNGNEGKESLTEDFLPADNESSIAGSSDVHIIVQSESGSLVPESDAPPAIMQATTPQTDI